MTSIPSAACAHSNVRILYFHHVGQRIDHYTSMASSDFQRALDILGSVAEFVDLRACLRESAQGAVADEGPEAKRVALTFDDGYAETLEIVPSLLGVRGITATFFVVASWFGHRPPHTWAPGSLVCGDAEALREVQARGHAVASHTWSHQRLDRIGAAAAHRELVDAEATLAAADLGRDMVGAVAYPFGRAPTIPLPGHVRYGFATARAPYRCVYCDPLAISRVYLDVNDVGGWSDAIAAWW